MAITFAAQNFEDMKFEEKLDEKIGRRSGFILPEGSLEALYVKVGNELPAMPERKKEEVSKWHRIRPYIYMAAMFAGIWCMMKVFHTVSSPDISLDNPPEFVAEVVSSNFEEFSYEDYGTASDLNDFELEEEVSENYNDIESFEKDFGYELKPEYANAVIPELETAKSKQNTQKELAER